MRRASVALALCGLAAGAQGATFSACGHPAYPPVSWVTQGQLRGLAPEVVRGIFREMGHELRTEPLGNWKRCLLEAQEGRVDVVVAAYRTSERERRLAFSIQYLVADPIVLFVRRDRQFAFSRWSDLEGKTVGLLLGDSFGERFDRFAEARLKVERVSRSEQNVRKLALGRIDFMPVGLRTWRLQGQRLGYGDEIMRLPKPLVTEHYYVAVRRGSPLESLLPHIDRRLAEMHADGSLQRLERAHADAYLAELEGTEPDAARR
ncbi:substrate-binding periplasmic protein [Aromatoleum petrolei]|uniref:Transporter substrate-binding domain-containing protein n=1 Tax=Aromatoleum petrolei TaxID=76116 RepID=A0ABX1MN61_9RHOO|nr:transporter substrate-binding domain-containing protein [Aromatoleum petrolei]NMF89377.1 transporter substrate-binding domain-containing protein [Aromatoleum petrolei]